MDPYCSPCFLWWMAQVPRLFGFFDTTVLDQATVIISIERLQGLIHRGVGQETVLPPGP